MKRILGAHKSISGGKAKAIDRVVDIGGNSLQIFSSSPRGWSLPVDSDKEINDFKKKKDELGVDPVYFHATYLVNLADGGEVGKKSKKKLVSELNLAKRLGVRGSIVHLGSFKSDEEQPAYKEDEYSVLVNNIKEVLDSSPSGTFLIAENSGTRKVGRYIKGLAQIIKDVNDNRFKICLDTCHMHAAGYNISTEKSLNSFLDDFDEQIGLDNLELWHLNDSKDNFGSLRDRHENIGEGEIGKQTFELLLNNPRTKNMPFIIETPGFDGKGPDKKNIDTLKSLIK